MQYELFQENQLYQYYVLCMKHILDFVLMDFDFRVEESSPYLDENIL